MSMSTLTLQADSNGNEYFLPLASCEVRQRLPGSDRKKKPSQHPSPSSRIAVPLAGNQSMSIYLNNQFWFVVYESRRHVALTGSWLMPDELHQSGLCHDEEVSGVM